MKQYKRLRKLGIDPLETILLNIGYFLVAKYSVGIEVALKVDADFVYRQAVSLYNASEQGIPQNMLAHAGATHIGTRLKWVEVPF